MPTGAAPWLKRTCTGSEPVNAVARERCVETVEVILEVAIHSSPTDRVGDAVKDLDDAVPLGMLTQLPAGGLAAQPPDAVGNESHFPLSVRWSAKAPLTQ